MNLQERITVQTLTGTSADGSGGTTASWTAGTQLWGSVDIQTGTRMFIQGQEQAGTIYTIALRTQDLAYNPPIENYRFIWNDYNGVNRTLKALTVKNQRKMTFTILQCIETNG